jgi:hypothetical protein
VVWRELYDHRSDPEETVSVIENPEHAEAVRQLGKLVPTHYPSLRPPVK